MNYLYYYLIILILSAIILFIIKFIIYPDNELYINIKNIKYNGDFTIPRKIHQIWIQGYDNINFTAKNVIKENLEMNPNWEYNFYDLEAIDKYIKKYESDHVYNAFKKINPVYGAVISDFFRYIVMYHEGGLYLDIKSKITKPLDNWVHQNKLLISYCGNNEELSQIILSKYYKNCPEKSKLEVSQFAFIYPKNFPLLRKLIDYITDNIYNYKDNFLLKTIFGNVIYNSYKIFTLSGPFVYSKFLGPYICNNDKNILIHENNGLISIYNGNILFDGTNGEYYKQQNIKKTRYKDKDDKIIL